MGFFFGAFFSAVGRFLLQLMLIIGLPRVLNYGLINIGQPLVISELLTGIIYGPSLMGRVPNWTEWIFPSSSLGMLNGLAQLGLILFMFVVGISLDLSQMRKSWKAVLSAAILGNASPFLAATPLAFLLNDPEYTTLNIGLFILLLAIGFGVSALAFLARVLGERNLLGTELAVITLCTTAIDTGVAWVELAIVLSVNATSESGGSITDSLAPLWIVLTAVAIIVVNFTVGRWILYKIGKHVHKKGQIEVIYFWMTIFLVFGVAWLTEEVGISGMLGAFAFGLNVPKNGTYNVGLKAKIEELLVMVMIPIYFTVSGLKTDFGLLTTWDKWLIILLFVVAATAAKLPFTMLPAKLFGLGWWDSLAFGWLMCCKGLVALVMFNLLLDAKAVTPVLFAMCVGYVVITTFIVTPGMRLIGALKAWGVGRVKRKKDKFVILMLPRTPQMAPPIMTVSTCINSSIFNKKDLPVEYRLARIIDPNERYVGLMTRKTFKQDTIFAPATQRAHFFKLRAEYEFITTIDPLNDLLTRLNDPAKRPDFFIMGNDLTNFGEELVVHVLEYHHMNTLVFTGHDFSNALRKLLLVCRGNGPDDTLALHTAKLLTSSLPHPISEVVVLLLPGAPPQDEIEFLEDEANYFGSKVAVSVIESIEDETQPLAAIAKALEKQDDIDFIVTPRFDTGESEHEMKHILTALSKLHCPSLYVSSRGSLVDESTGSTADTSAVDGTELTELTDTTAQHEEGGDEEEEEEEGGGKDSSSTSKSDSESEFDTDVEKGED